MSATLQTSIKTSLKDKIEIPILTRCCFCFPLRKGLISFAYVNVMLTLLITCFLSYLISMLRNQGVSDPSEYPRLITDLAALVLEVSMTIVFIIALHMKNVLLMKIFLYFEIVFSIVGLIYSIAFLDKETGSEIFVILFQLVIQIYLMILIWSSIVKMERDGTVKYTRDNESA